MVARTYLVNLQLTNFRSVRSIFFHATSFVLNGIPSCSKKCPTQLEAFFGQLDYVNNIQFGKVCVKKKSNITDQEGANRIAFGHYQLSFFKPVRSKFNMILVKKGQIFHEFYCFKICSQVMPFFS